MKEIPILFSGPMMLANLRGAKDVTRRVVTRENSTVNGAAPSKAMWEKLDFANAMALDQTTLARYILGDKAPADPHLRVPMPEDGTFHRVRCKKWHPGDVLYARETWRAVPWVFADGREGVIYDYAADPPETWQGEAHGQGRPKIPWKPSIHMPRIACRLTAKIVSVRIERLQEITLSDCEREGSPPTHKADNVWDSTDTYAALWDSINGPGAWERNDWVWRIEYRNPHKEYA